MALTDFCPHLTFRLSFRYDRQNRLSSETEGKIQEVTKQQKTDVNIPARPPEINNQGGGDDGIEMKPFTEIVITDESRDPPADTPMLIDDEVPTCDMCNPPCASQNGQQLWQCLDNRCGMILCGKSGQNHSQEHFEDFQDHMLQENLSTKRIWCNECNHEVLPYWGNRRPAPAVWVPPDGTDEEFPPPRGLYNIGNTCFMNAALQCMLAVTPLSSYFMGYCCSLAGRQVGSSFLWLLNEMWSDQPSSYQKGIMPSRLLHSVRSAHPIFRGCHQHDTQEFLRLFMDTLTEETRIPHFVFDDDKKSDTSDEMGSTTSEDSETDSFETCDSGNGSEETTSLQNGDNNNSKLVCGSGEPLKDVKVVMKSIVSDIFDGKVESSVQCMSCKQTSRRLEVFQDLSLPIPSNDEMLALRKNEKYEDDDERQSSWMSWVWNWVKSFFIGPTPSLEDCFEAFFSCDELKDNNMYSCEKCKKLRNGVKRCLLYELPEVLCIHLKRFRLFEYGGIGSSGTGKVSQYVQFPMENLELKPFLHQDCPNNVTNYRLLGTICHMGSFSGGHYISYIRRGDQWFLCDDSHIMPVSAETVAESEAYVLFYQKWDGQEDMTKRDMLSEWALRERSHSKDDRFHLISRKWLTTFCWGDESGPIDNSDVVCPHGYFAPHDAVHLGATWIPHSVWTGLMNRYGGGPDLLYQSECAICTAAWKKHQKAMQKTTKSTPEPSFSLSTFNITGFPSHTTPYSGSVD